MKALETHTHTHTHTRDDYSNPRCACAPRVNETVLDDPETAQYTHTLTVTTGGEYTCTVSNNKPSSDSASTTVPGIERAQCL